mgnify:CR=1 FL=1
MFNYVKKVIVDNYANFGGRASRSEFWYFFLFNILLSTVFYLLGLVLALNEAYSVSAVMYGISSVIGLALLIPGIAVGVRRLHDTGRSGWWWFINFIPCGIGTIWFIILACTESQPQENEYGPVPQD